jgi:hypothetical protein
MDFLILHCSLLAVLGILWLVIRQSLKEIKHLKTCYAYLKWEFDKLDQDLMEIAILENSAYTIANSGVVNQVVFDSLEGEEN